MLTLLMPWNFFKMSWNFMKHFTSNYYSGIMMSFLELLIFVFATSGGNVSTNGNIPKSYKLY